jgi:membrane-bound metal-dependent hydrolase YbcI (DUF457 family)
LVEPLLHFAVPFASLRAVGIDLRKAALASLISLAPDLDVFFHVHRSQSHSIIILGAIALPLLVLTRNRKEARTLVLFGTFGVLTHLVLDLFQAPTPLLWPLLNESLMVSVQLNLQIGSAPAVAGSARLVTGESTIGFFTSFDEPLLTAEGLGISLVLLAPTIFTILRQATSSASKPKTH